MQRLELDWLQRAGVELALLRLDQADPLISGNKGFKLAPHLALAHEQGLDGLISLGGAHSNHLHALAGAGARFGFRCVGLLRGHEVDTPTVRDLRSLGMELHWLGYGGYRQRHAAGFWLPWRERYPGLLPVAEGGGGLLGARGCIGLVERIATQLPTLGWDDYDAIWVAAGTGTTLAGLVLAQVAATLAEAGWADTGYRLLDASRGGFARLDGRLARFIVEFETASGVALEPLYTGKLLLALREAVESGAVARGSRLVALHSGGLQGRRALQERLLALL
ncbi:pyridoxal-phosphate dependent enzyme [Pseudomonas aeruginosa]|nr:pyridoxal-phosphate dependent enzyme [Pseudomonas aeruginosa]